jgi:hypothetical protein
MADNINFDKVCVNSLLGSPSPPPATSVYDLTNDIHPLVQKQGWLTPVDHDAILPALQILSHTLNHSEGMLRYVHAVFLGTHTESNFPSSTGPSTACTSKLR